MARKPAPTVTTHPHFRDTTSADAARSRFTFSASGTRQAGTIYVTHNLTTDRAADIEGAARIAAKRAGADAVTLHAIGY